MVDEVRLREGITGHVKAEGGAFPLFRVAPHQISKVKGHVRLSDSRKKNTHCVLSPELGSAPGHTQTHEILLRAMVFGFEIEGGLHEVPGARFAKELVADGELVEGFLK
jgi:hypothetical protein